MTDGSPTPEHGQARRPAVHPRFWRLPAGNQRGMALIMALLVVALLTISVVEFFFSTEVDSRMARNAVHGLQAALLARSGIALGEALLVKDEDPRVDSFLEEWCPAPAREGRACQIEDGGGLVLIPDGMRLRVEIWDESGKININNTKPQTPQEARLIREDLNSENPRRQRRPQQWVDALANLFEARGASRDAAFSIEDYWIMAGDAYPANVPGQTPTAGQAATPTPEAEETPGAATPLTPWDALLFQSVDDLSRASTGLGPGDLRRLRPFLTAAPFRALPRINANTASREVLGAIVANSPEWVDEIISRRQSEPIALQGLGVPPSSPDDRGPVNPQGLIGVTSNLFLIRASAIVNVNPMTGRGGISRSAEMLVMRQQAPARPGSQPSAAGGTLTHWKLTRLHWQKEGGAVLFRPEVESGAAEMMESQF